MQGGLYRARTAQLAGVVFKMYPNKVTNEFLNLRHLGGYGVEERCKAVSNNN